MPSLTVKGIPDDLFRRLKELAAAHRRSLNGEVIVCLERAVGTRRMGAEEFLARADALRERLALTPLTDETLRAARDQGRP